jgi:hypothetical protein
MMNDRELVERKGGYEMENKYTATVVRAIGIKDYNVINEMQKTEVMDLYIKSFG